MANYSYSYLRNSLLDGSISRDKDSIPPLGSHVNGYVLGTEKGLLRIGELCLRYNA
jgi:hypothetical protein